MINLKMNLMLSIINFYFFFLFFNNTVIESNFKFVPIIMLHNKLSSYISLVEDPLIGNIIWSIVSGNVHDIQDNIR